VIGIFKQKSPANIVLLFIFGLVIKLPLFLYPKPLLASANDGRLYKSISVFINSTGAPALLSSVLAFLLLYTQAIMVNHTINEHRLTNRQTFLPGMAYLMITSLVPQWSFLSSALISNTFIILIFISLFGMYNVAKANSRIFNLGLLLGITSFLFFPSIFLGISILLALMILRPFRLNELALFIMGVAAPYYFFGVYLFLTNKFTWNALFPHLNIQVPVLQKSLWLVGATLLLAVPFLMGGYYIQTHLRKMLIQARKSWSILLLYLLLAFFIPFVNNAETLDTWVLTAAPFAAFHACAYQYPPRNWLPLALFYIMTAFIIFQQYVTIAWH
jgi:hypothetical protein